MMVHVPDFESQPMGSRWDTTVSNASITCGEWWLEYWRWQWKCWPVCDETKNLTSTGFGTLFGTKFSLETGSETFFGTKFSSRPIPRTISGLNFSGTDPGTFFGAKFFRFRFRYHQKKWRIPGNGNSRDRDVTLWTHDSIWQASTLCGWASNPHAHTIERCMNTNENTSGRTRQFLG